MSVAPCLLVYVAVVAVLGPRLLVRWAHDGLAPRLGVAAWISAIASVLASSLIAAVLVLVQLAQRWDRPWGAIAGSCVAAVSEAVSGKAGIVLQASVVGISMSAVLGAGYVGVRLARRVRAMRRRTDEHARAAWIIGRRLDGIEALVVDAPERAAYCVPGRPHAIVVTSAALAALDDLQLGAVLAHERAHLAGRHPQLITLVRGLAATLPRVALFTTGAAEIARLLEMCADDTAARSHGPRPLLEGLLALTGISEIPAPSMGAAAVAVLARATRLASQASPAARGRANLFLAMGIAASSAPPLLTVGLLATGNVMCGSMALV